MKKILLVLILCVTVLCSCNGTPERVKRERAERARKEKILETKEHVDTCDSIVVKPTNEEVLKRRQDSIRRKNEEDVSIFIVVSSVVS